MRIGAVLGASLVLAFFGGCGSDRMRTAVVLGKVTYKDKPVPNGTVMFVPEKGPPATGEIQADGTYRLKTEGHGDGAILGKHAVIIAALEDMSKRLPEERTPLPAPIIPAKYERTVTSGLTADVKAGENKIDFVLK